jgi:hypothetical protein
MYVFSPSYLDLYHARLTSSQHGQPLQVIDMGETALDEQIFEEYLAEMRDHYTADKVWFILPGSFPRLPRPRSIISWVMTISMQNI